MNGRKVTTVLVSILPHEPSDDWRDDDQMVIQLAEEVCQLARHRIRDRRRVDAGRPYFCRRDVHFQPGDRVRVWTPIRRHDLSDKLLKWCFGPYNTIRRLVDLNYQVLPDETRPSGRC